jgi:hypothetical protein
MQVKRSLEENDYNVDVQRSCKIKKQKVVASSKIDGVPGVSPLTELLNFNFNDVSFDWMNYSSSLTHSYYRALLIFAGERAMKKQLWLTGKSIVQNIADSFYSIDVTLPQCRAGFVFKTPSPLLGMPVQFISHSVLPGICEIRAIKEGLFPESEQVFIFHEVIDQTKQSI